MSEPDLISWAIAYVEAQSFEESVHENHPLWWPIGRFFDLQHNRPEECWQAILAVLDLNPPERVLGMLAAGPLEDLIEYHGEEFIRRIEIEAWRSLPFRLLLQGVWSSGTPAIWARVEKARTIDG
ncbi:MAG: hypothetical protein JOY84_18125 [Curvibacter sp.]|nr:hypothetical protein [Curvibacter sp.]